MSTAIGDFESGESVEGDDRLAASGEPSVLKVSAVSFQGFRPLEHKAILRTTAAGLSVWPKRNQVLVTRANTPDLVGAAVWVSADHPDRYLPDKIWQTQLDASSLTHPRWLVYLLTMQALRHAISVRATGTSGSMKNISQKAFLQIKIPLPSPNSRRSPPSSPPGTPPSRRPAISSPPSSSRRKPSCSNSSPANAACRGLRIAKAPCGIGVRGEACGLANATVVAGVL
jgi:hypothetical protein